MTKELTTLKDINTETIEGRYLMAAMAKLTTENQTDKHPDEVLQQITELQKYMYEDNPPAQDLTAENLRLREALEKILKAPDPYNERESDSWIEIARSVANDALKPDNSK